jgi:SAM-dependent methyltransferase
MPGIRRVALASALAVAAGALVATRHRRTIDGWLANVRRYSAPSVASYDWLWARSMGGFYERVARETADLASSGRILDVGSGPGYLAVALVQAFSNLRVVGVDVSPEMIGRAREVAGRENADGRVVFERADVRDLPFPDASFDAVLSTFSMHHWLDPDRGLAEIHRVLKPGGVARIYDVADWISRIAHRYDPAADLVARSSFGGGRVETVVHLGPIPIVRRIELLKGVPSREE